MSARLDSLLRQTSYLDSIEEALLAAAMLARLDGKGLAHCGPAFVNAIAELAKSDPTVADALAQACASTFKHWPTIMSGALSAAIDEAEVMP